MASFTLRPTDRQEFDSLLGGIVLSLGPGLPISGYVATIVFLWYLLCRLIARLRRPTRPTSGAPVLAGPAPEPVRAR